MKREYRNTKDEINYFGSDINKFIHENCRTDMMIMNIDCVQFRYKDKYNNPRMRIIEYKHKREHIGVGQANLLADLASKERIIRDNKLNVGFLTDVYVIRGDYPFDLVEITNLVLNDIKSIHNVDKFKKFLNYEIEFEDI